MAKSFARRTKKKERDVIELPLSTKRDLQDIFKLSDDRLIRGAKLQDIKLSQITVRDQVRTKFYDASLNELSENIKANGLIQPLVLHREGSKYVLICGERRFRAMSLIKMKEAPCFILEDKTIEELMAIQFSENSSRENLHYIDKADGIYNYRKATGASERKITSDLGISKSEVHRSLILAKLPAKMKEAAKLHNIEKYVLLEWNEMKTSRKKTALKREILAGTLQKRSEFKKHTAETKIISTHTPTRKTTKVTKARGKKLAAKSKLSQTELLKALSKASTGGKLDRKTQNILKSLMEAVE
ncbi:MAG: ParB/RepB/Spo0J family partition protein [Bacteriovoracaceae bacterium]|jgi:ParB family transcriptional regulator, chromosome partitioning protein|nr:ParB/RepB/Spo0J family partition protein [Bacteriovoracaceae bacterium]